MAHGSVPVFYEPKDQRLMSSILLCGYENPSSSPALQPFPASVVHASAYPSRRMHAVQHGNAGVCVLTTWSPEYKHIYARTVIFSFSLPTSSAYDLTVILIRSTFTHLGLATFGEELLLEPETIYFLPLPSRNGLVQPRFRFTRCGDLPGQLWKLRYWSRSGGRRQAMINLMGSCSDRWSRRRNDCHQAFSVVSTVSRV